MNSLAYLFTSLTSKSLQMKPFCATGNISTICFCRGNKCFSKLWDVMVGIFRSGKPFDEATEFFQKFLVEMYREDNVAVSKSFKTKSYFDDFQWDSDYRAYIYYCLITELRSKNGLGK